MKDTTMHLAARRQAEGHLAWLRREPEVYRAMPLPGVITFKALFPIRKRKKSKRRKR